MKVLSHKNLALIVSVGYAFFSTLSMVFIAFIEGLFTERTATVDNVQIIVRPLQENYSTIIDFLFLNPLVLFFLIQSIQQINFLKKNRLGSIAFYFRLLFCLVTAFILMRLYYKGFLDGDYFDAVIQPIGEQNEIGITNTGKVVFFWTTIFLGAVLSLIWNYFLYVRDILSLEHINNSYDPLSKDSVGGQKNKIEPLVRFSIAMFFGILLYLGFFIQDYLLERVDESIRVYGFLFYIMLIISGVLLPIYHLHKLMLKSKRNIGNNLFQDERKWLKKLTRLNDESALELSFEIKKSFLDKINVNKDILALYPEWPVPKLDLVIQLLSVISALVPILFEFL